MAGGEHASELRGRVQVFGSGDQRGGSGRKSHDCNRREHLMHRYDHGINNYIYMRRMFVAAAFFVRFCQNFDV